MKSKISGAMLIIASTYYVLAEAISAYYFHDTLFNTYVYHTISELGIPNVNSPLSLLMNSAFIFIGLALLFNNYYRFKDYLIDNKILYYVLTLITSLGVIMVGLIHGGNPLTSGYHTIGAVMAIAGGNTLLIVISKSMKEFTEYNKITFILGNLGIIMFLILFFNMNSIYMPVFERISVYTMIIWSFITGTYLLKK